MFYFRYIFSLIIGLHLFCFSILGQNPITYNLDQQTIKEKKVDPKKDINFTLQNCGNCKEAFIRVLRNSGPSEKITLNICGETKIPIKQIFEGNEKLSTVILKAKCKDASKLEKEKSFTINSKGEIGKKDNQEASSGAENPKEALPQSIAVFVPDSFFETTFPSNSQTGSCMITYSPIENDYSILNGMDQEVYYLRPRMFGPVKKINKKTCKGVVVKVVDFNTLKYDIGINSAYNDDNTNPNPDPIFNMVYQNLGGLATGKLQNDDNEVIDKTSIIKMISDLIALKDQLEFYINWKISGRDYIDQSKFIEEKEDIAKNIQAKFPSTKSINVLPEYNRIRNEYLNRAQVELSQFNTDFKKTYSLSKYPDELAKETQLLVHKLMNLNFNYQYNIIQLQNRDIIEFTFNINPDSGSNGGVFVDEQSLRVPIRGGLKLDYSAGLYLSSFKNEQFDFKENYDADTLVNKTIVKDGDPSSDAGGIAALAHIYPRLGSISGGFTFGVGVSTELNYSLLFGGSVIVGRKKRVMLSGGVNYSSVKRLSNSQQIGDILPPTSDLKTKNEFRRGFFVAFTHNFGLNNATQNVVMDSENTSDQPSSGDNNGGESSGEEETKNKEEEPKVEK